MKGNDMEIGIVGLGAVGLVWAEAIAGEQFAELVLVDPHPEAEPRASWAAGRGLTISAGFDVLAPCQMILVCVPGNAQPDVVERLAPVVGAAAVVVDLSTAAVQDKERAPVLLPCGYVDVAIAGVVPTTGVRTPLLVAGEVDGRVRELLDRLQVAARYLEGSRAGDAVQIKLLRSVVMKGLEALAVEVLPAAQELGLLEQLYDAFGDVDDRPFAALLQSMVATHPSQAARRLVEAEQASAQVAALGFPTTVASAVPAGYAVTVDQAATDPAPDEIDVDTSLAWLAGRRTRA